MTRHPHVRAFLSLLAVAPTLAWAQDGSRGSAENAHCAGVSEEERSYIGGRHEKCLAQYGSRSGSARPRRGANCIYAACEQFHSCGAEDEASSASSPPPADSPVSRMVLDRAGIMRQLEAMPLTRACTLQVDDYSACNAFVSEALSRVYSIDDFKQNKASRTFPDHVANDIANYVNTHSQWSRLGSAGDQHNLDEAQRLANEGYAVIAVRAETGQGHVALIIPGESQPSAAWGLRVPNSASMFYGKPDKTYVGGMLSKAWQPKYKNEVLIYYRSR